MRRYSVLVGWSDSLPPEPLEFEVSQKSGYSLEYHKTEGATEEFEEPQMDTSLQRLISGVTRNRYLAKKVITEFSVIFNDLENYAVPYWKIMLKRRFDFDATDLEL